MGRETLGKEGLPSSKVSSKNTSYRLERAGWSFKTCLLVLCFPTRAGGGGKTRLERC